MTDPSPENPAQAGAETGNTQPGPPAPGALARLVRGDAVADSTVPPSGVTGHLTALAAAVMAFLAVFALALALAGGKTAERWSQALAGTATIEVPLEGDAAEAAVERIRLVLSQTGGIESMRVLEPGETRALLAPWLGDVSGLDGVALPVLLAVSEEADLDIEALTLRLSAEVPEAVYHRHASWQEAIASSASRVRLLAFGIVGLIFGVTAIVITLAARAALAMNVGVIETLRLLGARDSFVVRAFVRRFTLRGLAGATAGTALGGAALVMLTAGAGSELSMMMPGTALGWASFALVPVISGVIAFVATRRAAQRVLAAIP